MSRVTKKDIEAVLERLNEGSKLKYILDGAYGGWKIMVTAPNASGAIYDDITYRGSTGEVYDTLQAILKYKSAERNAERIKEMFAKNDEINKKQLHS